jgi:hypothetical protein
VAAQRRETKEQLAVVGWTTYPIEGLSAGHSNAVVFEPLIDDLGPRDELLLRLLYEDIAGLSYATDLHYKDTRVVRSKVRELAADKAGSPLSSSEVNAQIVSSSGQL